MARLDKRKISEGDEEERKKRRTEERKGSGGFWPFAIGDAARKLRRPLSMVVKREEPKEEEEFHVIHRGEEESSSIKTVIEHDEETNAKEEEAPIRMITSNEQVPSPTPVGSQTKVTIEQAPIIPTPLDQDGAPPSVSADVYSQLRHALSDNASLRTDNTHLKTELAQRSQLHRRWTSQLRRICDE